MKSAVETRRRRTPSCFQVFWWAHNADPAGALGWARDGCVGKLQLQVNEQGLGGASEKVAGARATGCAVVVHLRTGRAARCWSGVCRGLKLTGCTRYREHRVGMGCYTCWPSLYYHHNHFSGPPSPLSPIESPPPLPRRPLLYQLGGFGDECRSADKSSCCWLLFDPPHSWSWQDRINKNRLLECCWELAGCAKGLLRHSAVASST